MVMSPAGLGLENDFSGEIQTQLKETELSSRQKGCPTLTNLHLSDNNTNLVLGPSWVHDTKIDWQTHYRS
jgi:hypothetical protein